MNKFPELMKFQNWTIIAIVFTLSGCIKDVAEPTPIGYMTIYDASPDAPSLDIYLNDGKINTGAFTFSNNSGYLNISEGVNNLKFNSYNTSTKLLEVSINVVADSLYSLFIVNGGNQIEAWKIRDLSPVASAGKARVRFINLSPDSPTLKITNTEDSSSVFTGQSYRTASEFIEIPADGTANSLNIVDIDSDKVLTTVDNLPLEPAKYYTLVAKGFLHPPTGNNNKLTLQILGN
jgi:hypothetical protein